ncbi:hypothetical protein ACIQMJ_34140 [Actinosynnema sp. NPDC091369]
MGDTLVAAFGAALVVTVWLSVLRTVFIPGETSSRVARWTARALAGACLAAARRLPRPAARKVLDFCAPLSLFAVVGVWLGGLLIGSALIAAALAPGSGPEHLLDAFQRGAASTAIGLAALVSAVLVLVAFAVYLVQFTNAYAHREREVTRMAVEVPTLADADRKLGICLESTPREKVDDRFAHWAEWLADVRGAHLSYPALLYARPAGTLSWPSAVIIAMDVAAVVQAVAPTWAPGRTSLLIEHGSACVQRMAEQVGITLPATTVSLQGREEFIFNDTVRLAVHAGLFEERDRSETWNDFQRIRGRYAPYAMAVNHRLMYEVHERISIPARAVDRSMS